MHVLSMCRVLYPFERDSNTARVLYLSTGGLAPSAPARKGGEVTSSAVTTETTPKDPSGPLWMIFLPVYLDIETASPELYLTNVGCAASKGVPRLGWASEDTVVRTANQPTLETPCCPPRWRLTEQKPPKVR